MTTDVQPTRWASESRPPAGLLIVLLAIPIVAALAFAIFQPIQVLPRISLAPGFTFIDQDGNRLTSEDLRGSLVLYNFTYTRCADPCPETSAAFGQLQAALAEVDTGDIPLEYVTISFDPEHDTPEVLRAYADELGADTSTWHFVTGEPSLLKTVIGGGFSTFYEERADGSFEFTPGFALVDGWGILRATYRTATPDPEVFRRDLGLIVQEVRNSEGVNRYAYEAAHLFMCYPK